MGNEHYYKDTGGIPTKMYWVGSQQVLCTMENGKPVQIGNGESPMFPSSTCEDLAKYFQKSGGSYYLKSKRTDKCRLATELNGRCGPLFKKQYCSAKDGPWCNTNNGWCGNTQAHYQLGGQDYNVEN